MQFIGDTYDVDALGANDVMKVLMLQGLKMGPL